MQFSQNIDFQYRPQELENIYQRPIFLQGTLVDQNDEDDLLSWTTYGYTVQFKNCSQTVLVDQQDIYLFHSKFSRQDLQPLLDKHSPLTFTMLPRIAVILILVTFCILINWAVIFSYCQSIFGQDCLTQQHWYNNQRPTLGKITDMGVFKPEKPFIVITYNVNVTVQTRMIVQKYVTQQLFCTVFVSNQEWKDDIFHIGQKLIVYYIFPFGSKDWKYDHYQSSQCKLSSTSQPISCKNALFATTCICILITIFGLYHSTLQAIFIYNTKRQTSRIRFIKENI